MSLLLRPLLATGDQNQTTRHLPAPAGSSPSGQGRSAPRGRSPLAKGLALPWASEAIPLQQRSRPPRANTTVALLGCGRPAPQQHCPAPSPTAPVGRGGCPAPAEPRPLKQLLPGAWDPGTRLQPRSSRQCCVCCPGEDREGGAVGRVCAEWALKPRSPASLRAASVLGLPATGAPLSPWLSPGFPLSPTGSPPTPKALGT